MVKKPGAVIYMYILYDNERASYVCPETIARQLDSLSHLPVAEILGTKIADNRDQSQ